MTTLEYVQRFSKFPLADFYLLSYGRVDEAIVLVWDMDRRQAGIPSIFD